MKKYTKEQRKRIYLRVANLISNDYNQISFVCIKIDVVTKYIHNNTCECFPELDLFNNGNYAFLSPENYIKNDKLDYKIIISNMKFKETVMLLCAEMCN